MDLICDGTRIGAQAGERGGRLRRSIALMSNGGHGAGP